MHVIMIVETHTQENIDVIGPYETEFEAEQSAAAIIRDQVPAGSLCPWTFQIHEVMEPNTAAPWRTSVANPDRAGFGPNKV